MIDVFMEEDRKENITEEKLPFTTRTNSTICIYTLSDDFRYTCLQIHEHGAVESFTYDSFGDMIDDSMIPHAQEWLCDLEITVK